MREVVLDTETTGLDVSEGHRVIEIGALELINHLPTGQSYHTYINPDRSVEQGAFAVHGLSDQFLAKQLRFAEIVSDFLAFIGDDRLVIHNARFDLGFLNAELRRLDMAELALDRATDTVELARRRFPGAQASLDALCRRFEIDNSHRQLHGALVDADLLASVYLELIGGRQGVFNLAVRKAAGPAPVSVGPVRSPRPFAPSEAELRAHAALLERLKDPIWLR